MTIGIDARLYGTKHAGLGRYTQNLIKQLEKIDHDNQYFIFLQKDNFDDYQPENNNFQKVLANFRVYSWQEQIFFPQILKKYKLDFVHFTHFNVPFFYRKKFIVTIHDLIISHYPTSRATTLNPIIYKIKLFLYKIIVKSTAKRAKKIIAVSEYTKKDIVKLLGVGEDKIVVTYEGVDLPADSNLDCDSVLSELGINNDFLLYVGSAYPHKNLDRLVLAFKKVVERENDLQLILVGKSGFFYERLQKFVTDNGLDKYIVLTGYLDDKKLACLYKKAKLYVFPSLIEGFGLPPLEAQSYNLPVVSSNKTCLPEVLGDSVVYFDPMDENSMVKNIFNTLNSNEVLLDLKQKGIENLKKYSWEDCAKKVLKEYKEVNLKD